MFQRYFKEIDAFLESNKCIRELEQHITIFATAIRTTEEREQRTFSAPLIGVGKELYDQCYAALNRFSKTPKYLAAGNKIPPPYTVYGYISDHFSKSIAQKIPLELFSSPESFLELWSKMRSMSSMFRSVFRPIQRTPFYSPLRSQTNDVLGAVTRNMHALVCQHAEKLLEVVIQDINAVRRGEAQNLSKGLMVADLIREVCSRYEETLFTTRNTNTTKSYAHLVEEPLMRHFENYYHSMVDELRDSSLSLSDFVEKICKIEELEKPLVRAVFSPENQDAADGKLFVCLASEETVAYVLARITDEFVLAGKQKLQDRVELLKRVLKISRKCSRHDIREMYDGFQDKFSEYLWSHLVEIESSDDSGDDRKKAIVFIDKVLALLKHWFENIEGSFYLRNADGLVQNDVQLIRVYSGVVGKFFSREKAFSTKRCGYIELLTMWVDENVFSKKISFEDQKARLENVMGVVACVIEKDRFCELYAESLKNRLFFANAKGDQELEFAKILRERLGPTYTERTIRMIRDLVSDPITDSTGKELKLDVLKPTILHSASWSLPIAWKLDVPSSPLCGGDKYHKDMQTFIECYKRVHSERNLKWYGNLETVTMVAKFPKRAYTLSLKAIDAVVMMILREQNGVPISRVRVKYLCGKDLPEKSVYASLKTLSTGMIRANTPKGKPADNPRLGLVVVAGDDMMCTLQPDFVNKKSKINVPAVRISDEDRKRIDEKIHETRIAATQAAIVRVMKTRKVTTFNNLLGEVIATMGARFPVDRDYVRRRLGELMAREYIARDEDDASKLIYKP
eukprot:TRINITY_DN543_c0_g1_i2.p1 TRINITY_DN543_c0_g1~~TRINITY_DN543_c0_g1_i2.p1  ORF type:complete len:797 (+),score=187.58 TRINITY_DN543_c0_g1_i2:162-2552(+)